MDEEVVVAGAGFAGLTAAVRLKRKGFDVKVLDQNSFHLFKPGLVDIVGGRKSEDKFKIDLNSFFEDTGITFSREKILGIQPEREIVKTNSGTHSYDYLVLTLGGQPQYYGLEAENLTSLYDLTDITRIRDSLSDLEKISVVGSGYTGIEIASEIGLKDVEVEVIGEETRPMPDSSMEASERVLKHLNSSGIGFRGGSRVAEISETGLTLSNGKEIETDMALWAGGIQASEIVQTSFNVGSEGLPVNSGLSSKKYENVFAAGDNADYDFVKTAQNAIKQGRLVAENIDCSEDQALENFEEDDIPIIVSLGEKAMLELGEKTYVSKGFRYLESFIRLRYIYGLKKERFKLKYLM